MRSKVFGFVAVMFGLLLAAAPIAAHHSFMGEFDLTRAVTLTGTVTKVEWANPHISFGVDVKDDAGKVTHWTMESASPGALVRRGWTPASLKAGDLITIEAYPAKKGHPFAATRKVIFADGRTVSADSDGVRP